MKTPQLTGTIEKPLMSLCNITKGFLLEVASFEKQTPELLQLVSQLKTYGKHEKATQDEIEMLDCIIENRRFEEY